jgi:hypothetical protein
MQFFERRAHQKKKKEKKKSSSRQEEDLGALYLELFCVSGKVYTSMLV